MKATLEFDLPEDNFQFRRAINGHKWSQVVYDIDETFRREIRYNEEITEEQRCCYEKVRATIREEMEEHCLDFES